MERLILKQLWRESFRKDVDLVLVVENVVYLDILSLVSGFLMPLVACHWTIFSSSMFDQARSPYRIIVSQLGSDQ